MITVREFQSGPQLAQLAKEQGEYDIFVQAMPGETGYDMGDMPPYVHVAAIGDRAKQIENQTSWQRLDGSDITKEYGIPLFLAHNYDMGKVLTVLRKIFGEVAFVP